MTGADDAQDQAEIDALLAAFYGAFDNRGGRAIPAEALRDMFLPEAIVTRAAGSGTDTMTVDSFIAPRARMLSDGTLTDFHEWETHARTQVLRDIACRHSTYEKRGLYQGAPYDGGGAKLFQLVRTLRGWRIASIAWEDDP
ncbi:hypothetical protein [Pseudoxanthomonas winnipegensis]|uniref:hypothetical protein n=1 Tax=Pseudoxanthomonas winnipegensis TaxID=2480810 RepID=UPI003F85CA1B